MANDNPKARLLLVDDDRIILESLAELLRLEAYDVDTADGLSQAIDLLGRQPADIILTDVNMSGGDGFELLHVLRKRWPESVVIMMTAYGTIDSAVQAIKMGAYDYLTKPIDDDELLLTVERACAQQLLLRENRELKKQLDVRFGLGSILGQDYRMLKIFDLIEAVADSNVTVLIQGASGTGKSMTARVIHQHSSRRDKPFIEVSCGAIPESLLESELFGHARGAFTGAVANKDGKFKAADGGTLFLDEISTASPALQVKLLRVLQSHEFEPVGSNKTEKVDVRVVLASNVELEAEVEAGRFRQDLYYRINVVTVELPGLADRLGDVPLLVRNMLGRFAAEHGRRITGIDDEAMRTLQNYNWPGNVRELENAIQRAVVLSKGNQITAADLPARLGQNVAANDQGEPYRPVPLKLALEKPEKKIILAALKANDWNRQITAEQLEINRTTLYKKMKRYGLLGETVSS